MLRPGKSCTLGHRFRGTSSPQRTNQCGKSGNCAGACKAVSLASALRKTQTFVGERLMLSCAFVVAQYRTSSREMPMVRARTSTYNLKGAVCTARANAASALRVPQVLSTNAAKVNESRAFWGIECSCAHNCCQHVRIPCKGMSMSIHFYVSGSTKHG